MSKHKFNLTEEQKGRSDCSGVGGTGTSHLHFNKTTFVSVTHPTPTSCWEKTDGQDFSLEVQALPSFGHKPAAAQVFAWNGKLGGPAIAEREVGRPNEPRWTTTMSPGHVTLAAVHHSIMQFRYIRMLNYLNHLILNEIFWKGMFQGQKFLMRRVETQQNYCI